MPPTVTTKSGAIFYPESDGQPLAENTRQLQWIMTLVGNLMVLYRLRADVFVGGDQFWYPVEGSPDIRVAPDVYVVFGRPKGHRPSYRQWEEGNIPLTVIFEILSPGNEVSEMLDKFAFYQEHGVEEYYVYDPSHNQLTGYVRRGDTLVRLRDMDGFVSPRLGIRFDQSGPELIVRYPDGRPFLTFEELAAEREQVEKRAMNAEQRAARMADLSRKALHGELTPEEKQELERLLQPPSASPR
jgi:Uma2 family endonuclease